VANSGVGAGGDPPTADSPAGIAAAADPEEQRLDELMALLFRSRLQDWPALVVAAALDVVPGAAMALVVRDTHEGPRVEAAAGPGMEAWVGAELEGSSAVLDPVLRAGMKIVLPLVRLRAAGTSMAVSAAGLSIRLPDRHRAALLVARSRSRWAVGSLDTATLGRLAARVQVCSQCTEELHRRTDRRMQDERFRVAAQAEEHVVTPLTELVGDLSALIARSPSLRAYLQPPTNSIDGVVDWLHAWLSAVYADEASDDR
jgi:hypothetical protein